MKAMLVFVLATAFSSIAVGQQAQQKTKSTPEAQVMRLEDDWVASRANKDPAPTKALLADDYLGAGVSGQSQTKQQFVDLVSAGQFAGKPEVSDRKVRVYGGTAVSTGLITGTGQNPSDKVRYMRVYVKRNNQWRLVASQGTRLTSQ